MDTTGTAVFAIADEDDLIVTINQGALRTLLHVAADTLIGLDEEEIHLLDLTEDYRQILVDDALRVLEATR